VYSHHLKVTGRGQSAISAYQKQRTLKKLSTMKTVHLRIEGKVQGVWYRAWTRDTATELGLNGWVRNRMDGSVEAIVSGDETTVDQLIEKCHQGPPAARVHKITATGSDESVKVGFVQERTI